MVVLSSNGEVGQFVSLTQFDGGSTGKCGFYATATLAGSAAPGKQPWTVAQIAASADKNFVQFDGADVASNQTGMTQATCHTDLATYNLIGTDINPDWNSIKTCLSNGYPVIVCIPESQVYDVALNASPYPWNTNGYDHIVLLTGISKDGNVLVRDSANIVAPNNIRPGPREYRIAGLNLFWAVAVKPAWYSSTQSSSQGDKTMTIPIGWKDDGTNLSAPNCPYVVTEGFREYILTQPWDAWNVPISDAIGLTPLELGNTAIGGGTRQYFRDKVLEWTTRDGVFEAWSGQELLATVNILHKVQNDLATLQAAWNKIVPEKNTLAAQVAQLTSDLNTLKAQPAGNTEQLQQQVESLTAQLNTAAAQVKTYYDKLVQINTSASQIVAIASAK